MSIPLVSSNSISARIGFSVLLVLGLLSFARPAAADLLVTDVGLFGPSQILRYDDAGNFIGVFATQSDPSDGGLNGPVGLRLDGNGDLLVTNQNDGRILKYNVVTGDYLGDFYAGPDLAGPSELRFGPDGNLYVANLFGNSISQLSPAGDFIGSYTTGGSIAGASSFAFSSTGELYVGSFNTGEVLHYDAAGVFQSTVYTGLPPGVSGLVFDEDGDLWFSAVYGHQVFELDVTASQIKSSFTTNFGGLDTFPGPMMFAPGNPNELWVSLTGAGGVYKFSTDGTLLGTAAIGGGLGVPGQTLYVSAVPEPGTGLVLTGLGALMTVLRRRRTL